MIPETLLEAREMEHRLECARLQMQILVYREALLQAGVTPPDKEGQELLEMWQDCRAVISTANEFVAKLGSAKELLKGEGWRSVSAT
jgi:hypothetical protein